MSDTAKREAVVERFYAQHYGTMMGAAVLDVLVTNAMADRIVELEAAEAERDRLRRILAALREPSEGVVDAMENWLVWTDRPYMRNAIRAAVAAAEQEVGRE